MREIENQWENTVIIIAVGKILMNTQYNEQNFKQKRALAKSQRVSSKIFSNYKQKKKKESRLYSGKSGPSGKW